MSVFPFVLWKFPSDDSVLHQRQYRFASKTIQVWRRFRFEDNSSLKRFLSKIFLLKKFLSKIFFSKIFFRRRCEEILLQRDSFAKRFFCKEILLRRDSFAKRFLAMNFWTIFYKSTKVLFGGQWWTEKV